MDETRQRPLSSRILRSRILWTLLFIVAVIVVLGWSQVQLSGKVQGAQAQFVADSVRRCAVQCYAIEGRFPDTSEGVKYLETHYGLIVDHKRYVVYYESMGDNLIPQIEVVAIPQLPYAQGLADFFGLTGEGG